MTSEELDAQRIALVATLATQLWLSPDVYLSQEDCVTEALAIIRLAEQAVRAPTGDGN